MARVRGDPITTALAHPTRRSAYIALSGSEEMSTVQLQEAVGVDRYNLYHHLKKLASLELV
ncbi:MAG: helix-turn-helix domain-containing protein, partial [Candidatus Poseidonia sp.]|nr:helix-turn-helix domain-containing protein [Poseidonia sp.]